MRLQFQCAASQVVVLTALVMVMMTVGYISAAEEKSKSGSSSGPCTPQVITDMKSAMTDCMPKSGSGQPEKEKGGSKGTKSGNLLDADRSHDIEPRLAYLQQSSGGSSGGAGQESPSAKGGAKGANDTTPLVCTLTKMKGKNKNLDEVMTQCQQAGANSSSSSSSDTKSTKSSSSGSSQAQKEKADKSHAGGSQGGGAGAAGATNPVETCLSQKLSELCPDLQSDPALAAAFPATPATTGDDKDKDKKHKSN